ncbi:MAG: hypothetical protein ACJATS_001912, partial [Psychroserpens sp.]
MSYPWAKKQETTLQVQDGFKKMGCGPNWIRNRTLT